MINEIVIHGLTMDSRQVKPGDLFIAVPGSTVDGRDYIEQAIHQGAAAVLITEKKNVGWIAARFFNDPSKEMPIIGITGTSGKTSTAHLIAQLMSYCEKSCGLIGTLGVGFLGDLQATGCTTPDPIEIQRILAQLKAEGARSVAMEVSSHALHQNRVAGVHFHTAIFTNLSWDHLDYHLNLQAYFLEKQKLFTDCQPQYSVINLDNAEGRALIQDPRLLASGRQVFGLTTASESPLNLSIPVITTHDLRLDQNGIHAFIRSPWGEGQLECPLLGHFNLSNLLAAIAALCLQQVPLSIILKNTPLIKTVPGRLMAFGNTAQLPLVVVDYAHKPEAVQVVLSLLRQYCRGQLWCVLGCGGDRDGGKRPLMSALAEQLSDQVIMTLDNPRTEDPNQIFQDMLIGLKDPKRVTLEFDRRQAIRSTIFLAKPDDVVVILGKGHEEYQIIGTEKIPFSDITEVQNALLEKTQ